MFIFMHSFIILFIQFGCILSTPDSNILERKIVGEELVKITTEMEEKWSNLIHPLTNILYATFYYDPNVKLLFKKGALKTEEDKKLRNLLMFIIVPEYFQSPIKLPPHILEYTKRHFGGYQLPMLGEMLDGKKVGEELKDLGDLYLNLGYKILVINKRENGEEMFLDFKHDYMLDKRYKFNEKAKILYMMQSSGIVVQNIFSIFAEAKLFIEIVVKSILLTCKMGENTEIEMNEEIANKSDITKCILSKKFKQKNLLENFGKIMNTVEVMEKRKFENKKKIESTFERIIEDARAIGDEMRKKYVKDKNFFLETQSEYMIVEQMKLFAKMEYDSEWNYLNAEVLQNMGICTRIFQCASIIEHEILMLILNYQMLIDLDVHINTLEYLQKSTFLLEKALEETILGRISNELKFNEKIEQLTEKWEKLHNKIIEMEDMMKKMGIKNENEELEKLKQERRNVEEEMEEMKKKNNAIKSRMARTKGFKRRMEKYGKEYSRIFMGFLPELIIPEVHWDLRDSKKLANENAKIKFLLNDYQKIKIVNMLIYIMENSKVSEITLKAHIDEKHGFELEAMKAEGENENEVAKNRRENAQINERNFFKYLDNITKIILLDIGIWMKFPSPETKKFLMHSIIGSGIAFFVEKVIEKWKEIKSECFHAFMKKKHVLLITKKFKNNFVHIYMRQHERLKYKEYKKCQFELIFERNMQLKMLFIQCNNNIEDVGTSYDPMDEHNVNV